MKLKRLPQDCFEPGSCKLLPKRRSPPAKFHNLQYLILPVFISHRMAQAQVTGVTTVMRKRLAFSRQRSANSRRVEHCPKGGHVPTLSLSYFRESLRLKRGMPKRNP
jgi:hypothetical protein